MFNFSRNFALNPFSDLMPPISTLNLLTNIDDFGVNYPKINIIKNYTENKQLNGYKVEAYVGNIERENISLDIKNGSRYQQPHLIISLNQKETDDENVEYFKREVSNLSVTRTVPLPEDIDINSVSEAQLNNGILSFDIGILYQIPRKDSTRIAIK